MRSRCARCWPCQSACSKRCFARARLGAEQPVVAVEAVEHRLGDVEGARVVEAVREHGAPSALSGRGCGAAGVHAGDSARGTSARIVVRAGDGHRQVLQQPVVQAVDPAVHDDRLAARPGVLHDGRLSRR